jgi:outer membrane receptor protein involved in Fe transport
MVLMASPASLTAQQPAGTIEGTVRGGEGLQGLAGVRVSVAGTRLSALTDENGVYRITAVPSGTVRLITEYIGRRVAQQEAVVYAGAATRVDFRLTIDAVPASELVVTVSREAERRAETPATVGVLTAESIREVKPSHPGEIMNRIAGVWVNVTGGEGHMAAIRQPITTNPVYLYLEDGVPTRSTGFFNHNALYEIDVPHAERIEVLKGPATALYGSDAIGGSINVVTSPPRPGAAVSVEGGAWGFGRVLAEAGMVRGGNSLLAEINATRTDGWRDGTSYDRESGSLRWDSEMGQSAWLRTVLSYSRIDQNTAGSSAIARADYLLQPTRNYTPISWRRVHALRLHSTYERLGEQSLLTITPFVRWNEMDMLPNWTLAFDPGIWVTGHKSLGTLIKYRRDFDALHGRLIAGADFDYSPGSHFERQIAVTRNGPVFQSYSEGDAVYDYAVTYFSASPYVQAEATLAQRLRLTAGLRFDAMAYDYDNHLGVETMGRFRRPASTKVDYTHASPKLGATLDMGRGVNAFASYTHGFRAPSEGQLFRQGRAENTIDLEPVKADNLEAGLRAAFRNALSFEVSLYELRKTDDILNLTNADGSTQTANAGETLHRGIELAMGLELPAQLRLDAAWAFTRHTYEEWRPTGLLNYSGRTMETAPAQIGNVALTWRPAFLQGASGSVEWRRIGHYWMDAENTHRYPGHDLLALRVALPINQNAVVFGRVTNLTNERYAESASYTIARGEEFAPGMPRALYLGIEVR